MLETHLVERGVLPAKANLTLLSGWRTNRQDSETRACMPNCLPHLAW